MRFLAFLKVKPGFGAVVILSVILIIGAGLRLHDVESRTLNHPEVYAPGIDLPWHLSNPNPRFSLAQTLKGTIAGEPHPPGYYVLMLGWTKWFGSSILALRLPSVLFGVASILLIYVLARYTEDTVTALLAAAMLALNGLHLYYSQTARMYAMACFLGLVSTVLLVIMVKQGARPLTYRVLYVIVTVGGLATHVYFWPLFVTQALWVLVTSLRSQHSLLGLFRLQIFTFILATPLVAIAAYQSGAATRPETLTPLEGVVRFFQSGSLFEINPLAVSKASMNAVAAIVALLVTALLLASAVRRKRKDETIDPQAIGDVQGHASPHLAVTAVVGVLMALSILVFAYVANTLLPGRSTRLVVATSLLPIALASIDALLGGYRERFKGLRTIVARKRPWPESLRSVNVFLAVLPVSIVAVISVFTPIFVQRGTLIFVPYLLIVLASGLASLVHRDRRWVAVALILVIIHGVSVLHFKSKPSNPDFKALAEQWVSHIEDSDLIFLHGRGHQYDWKVAPIFYYLNARRYHYVGRDFASAIQSHPHSRVWVLSFPRIPTEKEAVDALAGYEVRKRVDAQGILAELYVGKVAHNSKQYQ
jgi:4-amino-4-deoxy-L-arabinose transferase-like glycosyltransferase